MKFIITQDYDQMSSVAADIIINQIKNNPKSVLGLATGSTPVQVYKYLIEAYNNGLDFSEVITFNLDEYYGLSSTHPQSYKYFMQQNLFNHINIKSSNIHVPDGLSKDVEEECLRYDDSINKAGGIDLQVLGIGRNGHIGFNEPDDSLEVKTHLTNLTADTIEANSRFFNSMDEVPKKALTMGLGTIMKAKKIVLLASGADKAKIIGKISQPFIDTEVPASILQLHNDTVIVVDKDAASLMKETASLICDNKIAI